MTYLKTIWQDNSTVVDSEKLNKIELGIEKACEDIELNNQKLNLKIDDVSKEGDTLHFSSNGVKRKSIDLSDLVSNGVAGPKGDKGDKGDTGVTPNITIGHVNTLSSETPAFVRRRGTDEEPIFDFGIPKGETPELDNYYTIPQVDSMISEISLTPGPKGDKGDTGSQGPKGEDGKDADIITLRKFGFNPTMEVNITEYLQEALDYCRDNNGGTIMVIDGDFILSKGLRIYKNTNLILSSGTTITATSSCNTMLINGEEGKEYSAYSAPGNIFISGGTWISNSPDYAESNRNIFGFAKTDSITVRDVTFLNVKYSHAMDISGSKNVLIENCIFKGYKNSDAGDRDYAEAIQLAEHTAEGFHNFPSYDGTSCENIIVRDCYFGSSDYYGPWAVGVGGHSSVHNMYTNNIRIENNTFENLSKSGVRVFKWKNVVISNNTFKDCEHGVVLSNVLAGTLSSCDSSGQQSNCSQSGEGITIENNHFINSVIYGSGQYTSIDDYAAMKDITLKNNTFKNIEEKTAISLYVCDGVVISDNKMEECYRDIYIRYVKNLICDKNKSNDSSTEFIISSETSTDVIFNLGYTGNLLIYDNFINNSGRSSVNLKYAKGFAVINNCINNPCLEERDARPAININSECENGKVENNYTLSNEDPYNQYGLYITSTCINVYQKDNRINGIYRNNYIAIESVPKAKHDGKVLNILDFGAIADGSRDNSKSFQLALDYAKELGGATIIFPAADDNKYRIKEICFIYSNTKLLIADGVEIIKLKGDKTHLLIAGAHPTTTGYGSGGKNISIEGGIFKGYDNAISMSLIRISNITVKNAMFYDCVYSGHVFDLMGCNNILIDNCIFQGFTPQDGRAYTEAIQVDCSTAAGAGVTVDKYCDLYDGTPTKDLTIQNCKALPIKDERGNVLKVAPNLIGCHGYVENQYLKNIKIINNYIEDSFGNTDTLTTSGSWIRFYSIEDLIIENNTFVSTLSNDGDCISLQVKNFGVKLESVGKLTLEDDDYVKIPQPCNNIKILNNTFKGFDNAVVKAITRIAGQEYEGIKYYMKNITIKDNTFEDCWNKDVEIGSASSGDNIHLAYCKNVTAKNNIHFNVRRSVYAKECNVLNVQGNIGTDVNYTPISINQSSNVNIIGNTFNNSTCGVYLKDCNNTVVNSNTISASNYLSASTNDFVIGTSSSDNVVISNNTIANGSEKVCTRAIYVYGGSSNINVQDNSIINFEKEVYTGSVSNLKVNGKNKFYTWNSIGDSITNAGKYQEYAIKNANILSYNNYGYSGYTATIKSSDDTTSVALKSSDFKVANIYTVFLGTNDFSRNCSIGSMSDTAGQVGSFIGGLKQILVDIYAKNKEAIIIFISPLKRNNAQYSWTSTNSAGHKLSDYRDAIKNFCEHYSLGFIDLYSIGQLNVNTFSTFTYDNLHPNDNLHMIIGNIIATEMNRFLK